MLKMVSKNFKSIFRKGDLVGRWGGEEFLAILLVISENELKVLSEKARMLVEKSTLRSDNTDDVTPKNCTNFKVSKMIK